MARAILSVQSWVSYGHVGNASAMFPLQRMGYEVFAAHTVQFSNHTGYGHYRGQVFSPSHLQELMDGMDDRGALASCDAVLSGYLGDANIGEVVLSAVDRVKSLQPNALYCCDPVMGDKDRGFFARPGIPEFFATKALPKADILTPNQFELEYLYSRSIRTVQEAVDAAHHLMRRGPQCILLTSLECEDTPSDAIHVLAVDQNGAFLTSTPKLPIAVNGAGDAIAAFFLGYFLSTRSMKTSIEKATASMYALLKDTADQGSREITLIESQEQWMQPPRTFEATTIL